MKLKLGVKLTLINIITIAIFLLVCLVIFLTLAEMKENERWVDHTYQVIQKGERLLALMVDQETGMRGFLATGQENYLDPYNNGKAEFFNSITKLQETVDDNPDQVELLKKVEQEAREWDEKAASVFIDIRRSINQFDALNDRILERMNNGIGKDKMDTFRTAVNRYRGYTISDLLILDMVNMETGLRGYLVTRQESFLEPYELGKNTLVGHLNALKDPNITALANDWIDNYAEIQIRDARKTKDYQDRGDLNEKLSENIGKKYMDGIRADIAAFVEAENTLLGERTLIADNGRDAANVTMIIGALLATAAGITLALYITRGIMKQIGGEPEEIAEIVQQVARGDLNIQFNKLNPVGIYNSMREMCEKLTSIIGKTKTSTDGLREIGESLSANAEESSASLGQVSSNLRSINDHFKNQKRSVEEVTTAVTQITSSIESLNNSITNQSSQVADSSSAIEEMVSSIKSVSENMERVHQSTVELSNAGTTGLEKMNISNEQVKKVADESNKLMETNQVINSIASQTNLLAMNAAIEAAHAGEAGKGFSVVADEIRKLAESASSQSQDIARMLKMIQSLITDIVNSSDETTKSFEEIQRMVQTVSQRSDEVRMAMEEQSSGSKMILDSLNSISQITDTVRGGAEEIRKGSVLVQNEAMGLKEATNDSSIRIADITSSAEQINQAVESVMDMSITNKEMVDRIVSEVGYFNTNHKE